MKTLDVTSLSRERCSCERGAADPWLEPSNAWVLQICSGRVQAFHSKTRSLSVHRRPTWNVRIILWALTSIEHAVVTHDAHDAMTNSVGLGRELWFKLLSGVAVAPTRQQCKFSRVVDA